MARNQGVAKMRRVRKRETQRTREREREKKRDSGRDSPLERKRRLTNCLQWMSVKPSSRNDRKCFCLLCLLVASDTITASDPG